MSVKWALDPIQTYCLENRLPPLTAIVIGKTSGIPGDGFIAWDVDDIDSAHKEVFSFDWRQISNPYESFGPTDTSDSLSNQIIKSPESAGDVYTKVKVRGVLQHIFRAALIKVYGAQCAICGSTFEKALDAAHIKSWQDSTISQRLDTRNGLLLCATHHRLFDAGYITISCSYNVHYYDPRMDEGPYSEFDKKLSVDFHGKRIFLPSDEKHWPSKKYLTAHHIEKGWGEVP